MKWQTTLGFFLCLFLTINAAAKTAPAKKPAVAKPAAPAQAPAIPTKSAPVASPIPTTPSVAPSAIAPSPDTIGLGAMVGTIGAINIKYWFEGDQAVDVGVEFLDKAWQVFFVDYYFHSPGFFSRNTAVYIGLGTGGGFWKRADECGRWHCKWNPNSTGTGNGFFVRSVVGNEWFFKHRSYSAYIEAGPSFMWYPASGNTTDAAIGGRIYF